MSKYFSLSVKVILDKTAQGILSSTQKINYKIKMDNGILAYKQNVLKYDCITVEP